MVSLDWIAPVGLLKPNRCLRQGIALGLSGVLIPGLLLAIMTGVVGGWDLAIPTLGLTSMVGMAALIAGQVWAIHWLGGGFQFRFVLSGGGVALAPVDPRLAHYSWLAPVAVGLFTCNGRQIADALRGKPAPQHLTHPWEQFPRLVLDGSRHTLTLIQPTGETWELPCTPEVFSQLVLQTTGLLGKWSKTHPEPSGAREMVLA